MSQPNDRRYLKSHEWHKLEGDVCTIGITQFAADELTAVTYVSLPSVGKEVMAGKAFGEIESVKATSELIAGVTGIVMEINKALQDNPELVNSDPMGAGWMVKVRLKGAADFEKLLPADAYEAQLKGH